jgi:hypothetical protein
MHCEALWLRPAKVPAIVFLLGSFLGEHSHRISSFPSFLCSHHLSRYILAAEGPAAVSTDQ